MANKIQTKVEAIFKKGFTIDLTEPIKRSSMHKALGFVDGEGTRLAEQEVDFLTQNQSKLLRGIRTDGMSSATKQLESLVDQNGNVRRVEPGVELTDSGSVSSVTNTLATEQLAARYFISYDWLVENALTAASEQEVLARLEADLITAYENDIAFLAMTGSSDGNSAQSTTLRASVDGFLAIALDDSGVIKASGSVIADKPSAVVSALSALVDAIPDKEEINFADYKFHMRIDSVRAYKRWLQDSGSTGDLAHKEITDEHPLTYEGFSLIPTQFMPDRFILASPLNNMVRGRSINMTVKLVDEPSKFGWDIFLYSKEGFQFVKSEKVVLGHYSGSDVGNWVAGTV